MAQDFIERFGAHIGLKDLAEFRLKVADAALGHKLANCQVLQVFLVGGVAGGELLDLFGQALAELTRFVVYLALQDSDLTLDLARLALALFVDSVL